MDPICHTLVGAALARTGLERRTPLATSTLLIGANLPDIDVVSYAWGPLAALDFRRGWTHGVLALAVLPVLLAGGMLLWDRWRRRRHPARPPARGRQLLLLAALAIATHPVLDTLNTYGVRWLMPFSDRWFYGDGLFIVDVWVWLVLAVAVWASWRRGRGGAANAGAPARYGLALFATYAVIMTASAFTVRGLVAGAYRRHVGVAPRRVLASPVPLTPFRRTLVIEGREGYRVGEFFWLPWPHVEGGRTFALPHAGLSHDLFARAAHTPEARRFLRWARFPTWVVTGPGRDGSVYIIDLRYATGPTAGFGTLEIPVRNLRATIVQSTHPAPPRHPAREGS